jgi:hypothetical protein
MHLFACRLIGGLHKPRKLNILQIEVKNQDGKGKVDSAGAGSITDGRRMPSAVPKPKTPEIEVRKADGKGKADSAGTGSITDGRRMPLAVPKPKTPEIEARKQDGKRKVDSASAGEDGRAGRGRAGKPPRRERAPAHCIGGGSKPVTERRCRIGLDASEQAS